MKPTLRLYEIADTYLAALDHLLEMEELPPEAIADTLEALEGVFEDKALSVARYVRNLEAEAAAIEEAKARMETRAKTAGAQAARLKAYLKGELERTGLKLKAPDLALRIQKNPPSVIVDDPISIPESFKRTETVTRVLKAELGKALKAGEAIAGVHLEQSTRLVIA